MASAPPRVGASVGGLGHGVWAQDLAATGPAQSHPGAERAFILDGAPIDALELGHHQRDGRSMWAAAELRRFASVPMRLAHIGEDRLPKKAPVFTDRITPEAKDEIRDQLEQRFDYNFATVYADIEGMAEYVRRWPEQIL